MKKLFTIVCLLVSVVGRGQSWPGWNNDNVITFDPGTAPQNLIVIDTTYHRNNWQIGGPQKTAFDSAYSLYNAIVTDTSNPYTANDTSVFILRCASSVPYFYYPTWMGGVHGLSFRFKLDIDSSTEIKFEFSRDHGAIWYNLIDTLPFGYSWIDSPDFSPGIDGWRFCNLDFYGGGVDTLLFRFTLITDTDATARDGWMIDDINIRYAWDGAVSLLQNPNLITLYPNPSHDNIYIHTDKPRKDATITIHDMQGRQVYSGGAPANGHLNLQLPDGVYTLKYSDEEEYCVKQIVIQN